MAGRRWNETESENVLEELAGYQEDICQTCHGYCLRPEALMVQLNHHTIDELVEMPVDRLLPVLKEMELLKMNKKLWVMMIELEKRLFLWSMGVGYLSLMRRADTLGGGESQRIRLHQIGLASSAGFYVLDEPTIGLIPEIPIVFCVPFAPFEILAT